ncbi:uncharacterized protein [Malus domestica]|uniref:uncharacterized protein isoform X6 n=1 Tax=Malus domestica TaxID=3750 RepID=UPI0039752EB6
MDQEIQELLSRRASVLRPSHIDREMDPEIHELLSRRASALRPSHIDREMDPEIHKLLPRRASALRPSHIDREMNPESHELLSRRASALKPFHIDREMDPKIHELLSRRASTLRPSHIDREMDPEIHKLLPRRASALRPSHIDREMNPESHELLSRRASALKPSHIGNSESSPMYREMDSESHELLSRRASALRPSHIDREMDPEIHKLLPRRASALRPSHIDREMNPESHELLSRRASALKPSHIGNSESSPMYREMDSESHELLSRRASALRPSHIDREMDPETHELLSRRASALRPSHIDRVHELLSREALKSSRIDKEMDPKIHFSHRHSLTLKEEKKNDGPLEFCNGCLEPVIGPHYACDTCNMEWYRGFRWIIHKQCAELPREISHPIHPNHPLILTDKEFHRGIQCGVCSQLFPREVFLAYYCSGCNFWIDIKCASQWQNQNDGHKHNFTTLTGPIKFTCDFCGQGDDDLQYNYICKICQLIVHRKCSWLPLPVKIPWHQHQLKLTWWFQDKYPNYQDFCDICEENVDGIRALYCCHDDECRGYAAHSKCIRISVLIPVDDNDEPSTSKCPSAIETTADDKALQIEHFSHPHMLTLIDGQEVARQDDQDEGITCNGCTLPIMRGESYRSCAQQAIEKPCNFSLHINCAKLPQKTLLPLHEHELTLLPTASSVGGVFMCDMCASLSQGFSYHCQGCDYYLDIYCSLLYERRTLRCDAHDHTLRFSTKLVSCNSCRTRKKNFCFRCGSERCNFQLCISCVKLPLTVRYKYDDHPLKLTYTSAKNDLDEYYCDKCEGIRDRKHWFYSCPDCDFECHPDCIRGRYPQVKLGGCYKHDDHQHNVALVDKRKSEIPNDKREHLLPCSKCSEICQGLVCECLQCGINIHREHKEFAHNELGGRGNKNRKSRRDLLKDSSE